MINGLTSIAVGIYLLAVLFHMNHNALLAELMEESGFLKWGAAVIILLFIAEKTGGKFAPIVTGLLGVAAVAMVIGDGGKGVNQVADEVQRIFGDGTRTARQTRVINIFK